MDKKKTFLELLRVGHAESNKRSFHLETNRNGEHLIDFATECGLVNLSLQYTKRKGKLWTFSYPNGIKAQLDYILINKKWRNSALNCEAYDSFTSVNSDHRIVSAKIRLSLRMHRNKGRKKVNFDWNRLLSDNNIKSVYSVDVKNRFEALQATGNDDDNNADTTYNPEERLKKWKDHFENLLGKPPVISEQESIRVVEGTLPINTEDFTKEELLTCIKSFKNGKAAGLDDIPVEVWKTEALTEPLLNVCNKTFHGDKPKIWGKSGLKPLPKKGDLGNTGNYRGISLTVIASKISNKMLLQRIRPHLEPILRMNQNGFRPNRSTLAQILTLRRLVEGIKSNNLPAVLTFVDFSKAFDSIHRGKLMDIMEAYGILPQIIKAVNTLYNETEAQVLSPDGDTDFFQIQAGVLQGDTLAPILFILSLDYVMRNATTNPQETGFTLNPRRSSRHPAATITDADFADDIALLSDTIEKAQLLLLRVEIAAESIGLHVNEKKTEYISYNQYESEIITLTGKQLKCVEDFKYLGSWINTSEKDINTRIGLAWAAAYKMDIIWKSTMNKELKIQFFRSTVESVLLYGSESWTLTKTMEKRLDGNYTRLLRKVQDISWKEKKTNEELYG